MPQVDPSAIWDEPLRELFRNAPLPPPPDFEQALRRRFRRQRLRKRWGVGLGIVAGLASLFVGLRSPRAPETVANDPPEWSILFDTPPVDSLDVLAHQQFAYVAALRQLQEE